MENVDNVLVKYVSGFVKPIGEIRHGYELMASLYKCLKVKVTIYRPQPWLNVLRCVKNTLI